MPIGRFPRAILPKYPHLVGLDKIIWNKFIMTPDCRWESFDYDFHVGQGEPAPSTVPQNMAFMWESITQRRIDVIGYTPNSATIIEIKSYPTCGVLGQILAYRELYIASIAPTWEVELLVLCNTISRDVSYSLAQFNVPFKVINIE